ncbi:MAG: response regulator transcription factor [Chloroflexi bacterium]|nr:response regulator transcription factor [Chloroflexota bacterium]
MSSHQVARRIRVLLAYRQTLLRQGLRFLLAAQGDIDVLAEAGDGKEAVEKAEQLKPDVVLMDMAMPILNGVEATRLIKKRAQQTKVLLLTLGATDDDIYRVLQAGASGCLLKEADSAELALAIQAVSRGSSYLSPAISERMVQSYLRLAGDSDRVAEPEPLSVREREILQLIAEGLSNQEIARKLILSVKTVEAHKSHIMRKLNIRGRTDLIKYAIRKGLIDLDTPAVTA